MLAEIISIGNELLLGHTINRDAAILAQDLATLGIEVQNMQTVGDNTEIIRKALELAASRSDILITTGGLGPTDDDLTREAIALFAGLKLKEDKASAERLKEYFGSRTMSSNQIRQAYFPEGCEIFANEKGTAPGCALQTKDGNIIIMLPGPPGELAAMFSEKVKPYLLKYIQGIIYSVTLHIFGMGEGMAAEKTEDLMKSVNPVVAPYAHGGEMFIKVTAKADTLAEAREAVKPVMAEIRARLGDVIYGIDAESLESVAVSELIKNNLSLATAESCTGGLLAKRITDIPGSSRVFQLGLVTYSNRSKELELDVPHEVLIKHGAVSPETAKIMAENVRKLAEADFGIGITGIAGPDGGTPEKPVGLVYIAFAYEGGCIIRRMENAGRYPGREFIRERASSFALDMIRRYLQNLPLLFEWQ